MPTVVIADDSPTLRRIVGTVLERAGYTVVTAEDGVEAVQAVFANQPDAVILDVQMPRVSGYVAARLLKDDWQTADIPVLLLTSLDAASDRYWGATPAPTASSPRTSRRPSSSRPCRTSATRPTPSAAAARG